MHTHIRPNDDAYGPSYGMGQGVQIVEMSDQSIIMNGHTAALTSVW